MEILIGVFGLLLLLFVFGDFFFTTLSFHGYGWMSRKLNKGLGGFIVKNQNSDYYTYSGVSHLLFNSVTWLFLLILASWFLFCSQEALVINSSTQLPASILERLYFTCYVIATVGLGDFKPGNELGQIIFSVISFSGFIMLTLNITYLFSVIQAVKKQKTLALEINNLGKTPQALAYNFGEDQSIEQNLKTVKSLLTVHIIDHSSFPVILRFISRSDHRCPVIQCIQLYLALKIYKNRTDNYNGKEFQRLEEMLETYLELNPDVHEELDVNYPTGKEITKIINAEQYKKITKLLASIGKGWGNIIKMDKITLKNV